MAWRSTASPILGAALALAAMVAAAQGQPAVGEHPPLVRSFFELPVTIDRVSIKLEAMEIRPRGAGPFPLVVIAHGKASGDDKRRAQHPLGLTAQAVAFAQRGFAVAVAMRRGYGTSQGTYAENDGTCEATRFAAASRAGARDLVATIAAAAARPGIDRTRILAVGESVGGINALAMATLPPPGVLGVVSFAGGRGGNPAVPGEVCQPDRLIEAVREFGAAGRLPSLWVYSTGDPVFAPDLARAMHRAYVAAGGKATLAIVPASGRDGHAVLGQGEAQWRGVVDRFLADLGLAPPRPAAMPVPPMPDRLGAQGQAAFRTYVADMLPFRAFANSGTGPFGWSASARSMDEARRTALAHCQKSGAACAVVNEIAMIEDR